MVTMDLTHEEMIDTSKIHQKVGEDRGRIGDTEAARELAELETMKGIDAARARERELAEGLTEAQTANLAIMEHVKKTYSDACDRLVGEDGREVLRPRGWKEERFTAPVFFTQEGAVAIDADDKREVLVLRPEEVLLAASEVGEKSKGAWIRIETISYKPGGYGFTGRSVDLGAGGVRGQVSKLLQESQKIGAALRERVESRAASQDLKSVLAGL